MKKTLLAALLIAALAAPALAQGAIALPEPEKAGGAPLLDCLASRHSSRSFDGVPFTAQQLSNLLWAAGGINREDGRFTYPTALNVQDISIYAVTADGAYLWSPAENTLTGVAAGDNRAVTAMQPYAAEAAVNLVYVQNLDAWEKLPVQSTDEKTLLFGSVHAGAIAQNVGLYAASQGWANVVRGSFREDELPVLLKLSPKQRVLLTQSVGAEKK